MKILYFSYLYDIKGVSAGSANKAVGFMGGLNQLGHDIKIFWRGDEPVDSTNISIRNNMRSLLKKIFSKYIHEPKILLSNVRHIIQEKKIIEKENPDVVISRLSFYIFSSLFLCRKKNIPFIIEADHPPIYENNTFYGKDRFHLSRIAEYIEKQDLLQADAILVLSNILKDYFIGKGIPEEKMVVIPNGADPDKFAPTHRDPILSSQYNLHKNTVIGWVGSLDGEWSGLGNLIKMAKKVLSIQQNVIFLFVGGGKNKERFEQVFQENGFLERVILPGTIPYKDVPRYFSLMDIAIAPYPQLDFWYPSSMKVFEYMSSGKAVVASKVGQIKEVIIDGYNGCLFDPDIEDDLTNKVLMLLKSPELCQSIKKQARETILEKYTWKRHAQTIEDIIKKIALKKQIEL